MTIYIEKARLLFLGDEHYGCAETTFMVLKEAFGLPDVGDSSAAMALNGGIAYSGGMCGAITGSALAVGMLAQLRIPEHAAAKLAVRERIIRLLDCFQAEFGSLNCRELTGYVLRDEAQHREFSERYPWRERCMRQVEMVLNDLLPLSEIEGRDQALLP